MSPDITLSFALVLCFIYGTIFSAYAACLYRKPTSSFLATWAKLVYQPCVEHTFYLIALGVFYVSFTILLASFGFDYSVMTALVILTLISIGLSIAALTTIYKQR